jgi:hypothetical protein
LAQVRAQCLARIDDELDWIAEDSPRACALRSARPRFVASPGPDDAIEGEHERR